MIMKLCSRCKRRMAVIFVTRIEGDTTHNEGVLYKMCQRVGYKTHI